jgi:3',5'-nucleoside bisphosphate phosphatase
MIDLHTHTDESDGSLSPEALLGEATRIGIEALAITDHDTLAGYDAAVSCVGRFGLELVCGIELSTKWLDKSVHLLGYFLDCQPTQVFRLWLTGLQVSRRLRNEALLGKLCAAGLPMRFEQLRRHGRNLVARPHFAAVMVEQRYVRSIEEAFEKYLDEEGSCFVRREEVELSQAINRVRESGGIPVLAHPGRLRMSAEDLEDSILAMTEQGLRGIEAYHSDHTCYQAELFVALAQRWDLTITGGSDFHGDAKPNVKLGQGCRGNVNVSYRVLENLRKAR